MLNGLFAVLVFMLGFTLFVAMNEDRSLEKSAVDNVTIIELAKDSDDPLVKQQAVTARAELKEIQERQAVIRERDKYLEENKEAIQEKQAADIKKTIWSLLGVVSVMIFGMAMLSFLTRKMHR